MKSLTCILVLISTIAFGQNINQLDSLILVLPNMPDDTNKVWMYEKISSLIGQNDFDKSMDYAQKGIDLAHKIQFKKGEVFCFLRLGQAYDFKEELAQSFKCYTNALKIAESIGYKQGIRRLLGQLTGVYRSIGDYDKALEIHKKVTKMAEELNYQVDNSLRGMGATYLAANKPDSALYYTLEAYKRMKKDNGSQHFLVLSLLGKIYRIKGDYKNAMVNYQEILKMEGFSKSKSAQEDLYNEIADYYKQIGNLDSCIYYKEKTLDFALQRNTVKTINKVSRFLASVYDTKDPNKALKYYRLEASTSDSILSKQSMMKLQRVMFEEHLLQEEKIAIEERRNNQLWRNILLLALSFVGIITFLLYRNNKAKQETNHQLKLQKDEINTQREKVEKTLIDLKSTQAQLIQSEKLASLGELTAGIAHEIQNPLNFVNNFSEVSVELVAEMQDELDKGDTDEAKAIADDLKQNLQKITLHGGRASAIVRGMLEHSRASTGEKQPTNLNALADEYLRLAYHGLRAKNSSFTCELVTDFDANLPLVNVIGQDMGRVLLNLINNAFYAVGKKANTQPEGYQPTVMVSTAFLHLLPGEGRGEVMIRVKDNGIGMPDSVREKVFQPFFTTKPTGEGTGLGLSLAYDIVTKGHGGTIEVESVEGEGTTFVVKLPIS